MATLKTEEVLALAEEIILKHVKAMPAVEPQPIPEYDSTGDEEVMVVLLSDLQIGHQTPTTTARIIRNRMQRLTERVVRLADIHRQFYPIKTLKVFGLGDFLQGERVGLMVSLDELEKVVMDQIFEVAVPAVSEALLTWQDHFESVEFHGVAGNHGSLGRFASNKTNWDTIIYKTIQMQLANQPRLSFEISVDTFWQKVKVWKWVFLLVHGDNIKLYYNIPGYGITRHLQRWQSSLPGPQFHFATLAHFHVAISHDWNNIEWFVNGCFVSDDQWVLKKMGLASSTVQWVFGVHPRKGVTFRYKVRLD